MTLTNQEVTNWVNHLKQEAKEAQDTAVDLFKSRRYHFALFFCHLALEKSIKAIFLSRKKKFAPPVHDLIYLIKKLGISVNKEIILRLTEINTFNIRTRYEDYKREFYKKATYDYTKKWLKITEELIFFLTRSCE